MFAKVAFVFCAVAHVALSQCVFPGGQYLNAFAAPSCGNALSYGAGLGCGAGIGNGYLGAGLNAASIEVTPTNGGSLPVASTSSIAPNGLSLSSENAFEGSLQVIGELPFLSAVSLEGVLPSAGAGVVSYGCGNGVTAITNAGNAAGAYGLGGAGIGYGAVGYGSGLAGVAPGACGAGYLGNIGGCGCGCGY